MSRAGFAHFPRVAQKLDGLHNNREAGRLPADWHERSFVCHNLVVLIHEMYELGIEPQFWGEKVA